ncbi:unnamed protein product [Rodentolepis nana]|uniref:RGS domain-containing protein n=1 Tax=Rodentolepis nana TaxID=102285 RepID=A0A158QGK2_RODNA|nr:unnamed protein product [Rodentolepis nana]
MSYPPGSLRSCHEADGRSDRSGGSGGTGSGSGNIYGSLYGSTFSDCKWHHHQPQLQQQIQSQSLPQQQQQQQLSSTWQKWAASFDALLSDGEGVALFKSYLVSEGCGNLLDFWFAVQGFRSKVDPSDRKKILQLIKVIYQTYIRGSTSTSTVPPGSSSNARSRRTHTPVRLRPETRRAIADRLSHKSSLDQTVFDEAQTEIGHLLRTTAYQAFLKSDAFIMHIQEGSKARIQGIPEEDFHRQYLPTVEEDRELGQQPALKPGGSVTPATYHYFCGPPPPMIQTQQAPPSQQQQQCSCQSSGASPWGLSYYPPPTPRTCYPPAAPLTQENIQMTRFQRAELPVPQHLSCCPHCQTPFQQQNQQQTVQQQHQTQIASSSNPLSPVQHKSLGRISSTSGPRKWMDAICPKYEYCSPPLPPQGGFPRAPPNPYHVSFAPVSMQESEHHSLSSGAHTEESLSHTDGTCDDMRTRLHLASLRHTPRISSNYPIFEPPTTSLAATTTANPSSSGVFNSHKHKRGSSSSRRVTANSGSVAATTNKSVAAATLRDQNLAELDPTGFAKLLNERLQRVVEDQVAMERLERIMSEVGNEDEQGETGVEGVEGGETQKIPESDLEKDTTTTVTATTQSVTEVLRVDTETDTELAKVMDNLSVASTNSNSTTATTTATTSKPSVLQRPWADRLLAAAWVQHAKQGDNAQVRHFLAFELL